MRIVYDIFPYNFSNSKSTLLHCVGSPCLLNALARRVNSSVCQFGSKFPCLFSNASKQKQQQQQEELAKSSHCPADVYVYVDVDVDVDAADAAATGLRLLRLLLLRLPCEMDGDVV